jgi:hypothetical protein
MTWQSLNFECFGVVTEVASDAGEIFDALPSALPPGWRSAPGAIAGARFEVTGDNVVRCDGEEIARTSGKPGRTLAVLGSALRDHLARQSPIMLFIHAGVVRHQGHAIVIPGRSFSGKTTLVAALVDQGAVYYSDEYAVVDPEGMIHAFPKPLSMRVTGTTRHGPPRIPAESEIGIAPIRAGLIVVTRFEAGARWRLAPGTAADGAMALVDNTIAVRSRPRDALVAACGLARSAQTICGPRGEAGEVAAHLLEMAQLGREPDPKSAAPHL